MRFNYVFVVLGCVAKLPKLNFSRDSSEHLPRRLRARFQHEADASLFAILLFAFMVSSGKYRLKAHVHPRCIARPVLQKNISRS